MSTVLANGFRSYYQVDGDAALPVLVLSHSLGTNSDLWASQLPALCGRFRVLRYDIRGHGKTEATPGPYTIELLSADLLALLDALAIEQFDFCGVSLGGFIGQWLGANAPHRARRLVLANTAARIGPADIWDTRIATIRAYGMSAIADASVDRWFTAPFCAQEPSVCDGFRRVLLETPAEGYIASCMAIRDMDHSVLVSRIASPVLVVAGTMDRVTPPEEAAWLAGRIPRADLVVLPAAHLSNVEAANQFNEVVSAFLSSQEA